MRRTKRDLFRFGRTRRSAILALFSPLLDFAAPQETRPTDERSLKLPELNEDPRLPDGRSQKIAIAKDEHERALRDANELLRTAEALRDSLRKAGDNELSSDSAKRTEEIERLARRVRARLKF